MVADMRPSAGDLRHACAFERPVEASDGAGGATVTWVAVATLRGMLEEAGAPAERETAGASTETVRAILTVRWSATADAIAASWRVTIDGRRVWNVRGRYPHAALPGFVRFLVETGVAT